MHFYLQKGLFDETMKFLPLLWNSLWREKVCSFTLLSIFVAFLLFVLH